MPDINIPIQNLLQPILKNYSSSLLIIKRNWDKIISQKYKDYCIATKTTFKKDTHNQGSLYITCFNNVASFYIEKNKLFIIEKINVLFGYNVISDLKIKQEPKIIKKNTKQNIITDNDKSIINNKLQKVKNQNLQESLKELGHSLFNRTNNNK